MNIRFFVLPILLIALSCNSTKEEKVEKVKIENVKLDSDIDPVCKMPVKNDIKDTALYEGKLYGFCDTECKEAFMKNPKGNSDCH